VTSVLGPGINWKGNLRGAGGVRIEGNFEGDIAVRGLLVVGETGRVVCDSLRANVVVIAGSVRGPVFAEKLDIRATGRVWGDVVTIAFSTEEGAFLRGQVTMEERVDLGLEEEGATIPISVSDLEAPKTPDMVERPASEEPITRAVGTPDEMNAGKPSDAADPGGL
jgi:cytoskeletal protein CcmA (bactofilin family)